ncbi:WSC domain-containing protein [Rhexocercosporidium sp. MPI-PUGE-AT-0058]|nr:WSC domain-containing protein [Rhexocercosporidium sp. MPI-PUGE-AT-0058]
MLTQLPSLLLTLLLLLTTPLLTHAQVANETITPENSVNAKISPGNKKYEYIGCYAETTLNNGTNGLRALNAGKTESVDTLTVASCLDFCSADGYEFAGAEYTKECWCSHFLSSIAEKLDDSACDLACIGNTTQICGGALKLSVYTLKSSKKGAAGKVARTAPVGSILALGIAMGVLLCLA